MSTLKELTSILKFWNTHEGGTSIIIISQLMKLMPVRWSALSKGTWPVSDRTRTWPHILLCPKPDTHCARTDIWLHFGKRKEFHIGPVLFFSSLFLAFLLPIPTPLSICSLFSPSPSLLFYFSLFFFHSCTFSFSNSPVKSFPMLFHVSKSMLARSWRCKNGWESHPVLEEFSIWMGCLRVLCVT